MDETLLCDYMYLHMMKLSSGTVVFFFIIIFICCIFTITYPFWVRVIEPPPPPSPLPVDLCVCARMVYSVKTLACICLFNNCWRAFQRQLSSNGHVGNFRHSLGRCAIYSAQHYTSFSSECPKLPSIKSTSEVTPSKKYVRSYPL